MPEDMEIAKEKAEAPEELQLQDRIIVIGDSATVTGFKLAGVSEVYVAEAEEAEKRLVSLLDRENAGIIVVNESLLASLDWRLKKRIEGLAKPVIVGVPSKSGPSAEVESLGEMIKRALGFELAGSK